MAAQPGHTKDLQSLQLEPGLRTVDSPGVIFDDDEGIQGQHESSVLLRNVVKPEDVDDPISVGSFPPCSLARATPAYSPGLKQKSNRSSRARAPKS